MTLLAISAVQRYLYCPRQFWYTESFGDRGAVNHHPSVVRGTQEHRSVDNTSSHREGVLRRVPVTSETLGVTGVIDQIEHGAKGGMTVVEYKSTPTGEVRPGDIAQLSLYAACLQEAGHRGIAGAIYFTALNRRVPVPLDEDDLSGARELARDMAALSEAPSPPERLPASDPRCRGCVFRSQCQPEGRGDSAGSEGQQVVTLEGRQGKASLSSGRMRVETEEGDVTFIPLERVSGIAVRGDMTVTTPLIRQVLSSGGTVTWSSVSGYPVGHAQALRGPGAPARVSQYAATYPGGGGLDSACLLVHSKIENQRVMARRHGVPVEGLADLRDRALEADSREELFGIEGDAARRYFAAFPLLLPSTDPALRDTWEGRCGRGAGDPINVLLNYGYGVLTGEMIRAVAGAGLDPYLGVLHTPTRNKPALALDMIEPFRAPVVDSVVVALLNRRQVVASGFDHGDVGGWKMTQTTRRAVLGALNARLSCEVSVPGRKLPVTYRSAMELQVRSFLDRCREGTPLQPIRWR